VFTHRTGDGGWTTAADVLRPTSHLCCRARRTEQDPGTMKTAKATWSRRSDKTSTEAAAQKTASNVHSMSLRGGHYVTLSGSRL
jgi:hypothetical protein